MAYAVMAFIVMAYIAMTDARNLGPAVAHIVMAYEVMAFIVMAYIAMADARNLGFQARVVVGLRAGGRVWTRGLRNSGVGCL